MTFYKPPKYHYKKTSANNVSTHPQHNKQLTTPGVITINNLPEYSELSHFDCNKSFSIILVLFNKASAMYENIPKKSLKKTPKRQKNHRIQLKKQPKTKNQPFPQPKTGIVHYRKNHPPQNKKKPNYKPHHFLIH